MDHLTSRALSASMSDCPVRIVSARPPSKNPPPRRAPTVRAPAAPPVEQPRSALTSSAAIQAFLELIRAWKLPPACGWRMLTGVGWQAGSLTADQIDRVQHLISIDAGLRPRAVGQWMMTGNPAPLLCGSSPLDYLTRTGTRGYVALAQQVDRWARM